MSGGEIFCLPIPSLGPMNTKNLPRSRSRARLDLVQELLGAGGAWRQRGHDGGARGRLLAVGFGFPLRSSSSSSLLDEEDEDDEAAYPRESPPTGCR